MELVADKQLCYPVLWLAMPNDYRQEEMKYVSIIGTGKTQTDCQRRHHRRRTILIGPVFMLMVAKVRKNGPFLLTSLITGVVLVAATWMFPITGLVGGILCELCLRAGQFRKKGWLMLGFFCFNLGFIGDFLPLWFTKESYLEYAAQMMDAGYMATMEGLLTWPVFGVIVLSILVGSVLGSLLGMKLMRKHFVKAGLAQ